MARLILWDWNGTLLDDLEYAISVRNRSFVPMGFRGIDSVEQYRGEFTFPIRNYYTACGITDDRFEEAAHAWMDEYVRGFASVPLHGDARQALTAAREKGLRQVILSATEQEMLREQVDSFGLLPCFDALVGLGDIYAKSKIEAGRKYLEGIGISPREAVMIGDTLHDAEVAKALGTGCLLVCRGHQSRERLEAAGVPVLENLISAVEQAKAME